MIFTSYYANHRKFPDAMIPVCIAKFTPHYLGDIKTLKMLAPSNELLYLWKRNRINGDEYTKMFHLELLKKIVNVREVLVKLNRMDKYILLCYEKKGDFCHRHLLQEFCDNNFPELEIKFKEL